MTLWINKDRTPGSTIYRLSGRVHSSNLEELKKQLESATTAVVLDLEEITLVDIEVVRFLNICERNGLKIIHGPLYIREWMSRELKTREPLRSLARITRPLD